MRTAKVAFTALSAALCAYFLFERQWWDLVGIICITDGVRRVGLVAFSERYEARKAQEHRVNSRANNFHSFVARRRTMQQAGVELRRDPAAYLPG